MGGVRPVEEYVEQAEGLKKAGAFKFGRRKYADARGYYEDAIAVLEPLGDAQGATISILYSNVAQCFLSEELGRRAVEPAERAVHFDAKNEKALRRLCLALAAAHDYARALRELERLEKLAGRATTDAEVEKLRAEWVAKRSKQDAAKEERAATEWDMQAAKLKEKFDATCARCGLQNDEIAGEIADMIIRDGVLRAEKLANVYGLDDDDAENILGWIMYMLKLKEDNPDAFASAGFEHLVAPR